MSGRKYIACTNISACLSKRRVAHLLTAMRQPTHRVPRTPAAGSMGPPPRHDHVHDTSRVTAGDVRPQLRYSSLSRCSFRICLLSTSSQALVWLLLSCSQATLPSARVGDGASVISATLTWSRLAENDTCLKPTEWQKYKLTDKIVVSANTAMYAARSEGSMLQSH